VEAYQWASATDQDAFVERGPKHRSVNKRRREQLKNIISLCDQGEPEEVKLALEELDGATSQNLGDPGPDGLRRIHVTDLLAVKIAAERALEKIPMSGPDPQRAKQQFIMELACIFRLVTGECPGRRVKTYDPSAGEEYGPFRDFVWAALEPFGATNGCHVDIKVALNRLKIGSNRNRDI